MMVIEYVANAVWQLPLLAAGAWLLLRMLKPSPLVQHRVWLTVLALAVLLPLHGAGPEVANPAMAPVHAHASESPRPLALTVQTADAMGDPGGLVLGQRVGYADTSLSVLAFVTQVHRVHVNPTAARWITGVYLAVLLIGFFRLAMA